MKIDCKNQPCPEPVIQTKKALEGIEEGVIEVTLNSEISKQNVIKFAISQGCSISEEADGDDIVLTITKGYSCDIATTTTKQKILFLKDNKIGKGELGKKLMTGMLSALLEQDVLPSKIICVNKGVFLTTKNKTTITALKKLINKGVEVHSCGACLEHYELKLKVGEVANAYFVAQNLLQSEGVVSL